MGTTIPQMLKRFQQLSRTIEAKIDEIVENQDPQYLIARNKEQLQSGLKSDGSKISPKYRSESYSIWKYRRNDLAGFGVPDLKNTGAFYNGFHIEKKGRNIFITSSDSKTKSLVSKYGRNIFGITPTNKERYINRIAKPAIKKYVTSITGLKYR